MALVATAASRYSENITVSIDAPAMAYCVAMNLQQGLLFASDSRTNAGIDLQQRIAEDDAYFQQIRRGWGDALRQAFAELPGPPWVA